MTEYGTLKKLTAVINRDYYCKGDSFSADDAVVTAEFLTEDGEYETRVLNYGKGGYSVVFSTNRVGTQTAVFRYSGLTTRAIYQVLSSSVDLKYEARSESEPDAIYGSDFPGLPFKKMGEGTEIFDQLTALTKQSSLAVSGNVYDLTEIHRMMIAYLGDEKVREVFSGTTEGSYSSVVFLQEDADGWLTNMLTGFCYVVSRVPQEDTTYLYYPARDWGTTGRSIINLMQRVPEGYQICRETENGGDLTAYRGDQVLKGYTGQAETLEIPMGVTRVAFQMEEPNRSVKKLVIPESVQEINIDSVLTYLPNLETYEWADSTRTAGEYSVQDGMLYRDDGKTLVSVPAGRTEVVVPAGVTKLQKDCFAALSAECTVKFEGEKAPFVEETTGFSGTVIVPDSEQDVIGKDYLFDFGTEGNDLTIETENGRKIRYCYDEKHEILTDGTTSGLAGIPQDTSGKYVVDTTVKTIVAGAFAGCEKLSEIEIAGAVTELQDESLVLPESVEAITILKSGVQISDHVFGNPETQNLPGLAIYVWEEDYDAYLKSWSAVLDPVYGEGTAAAYLVPLSGEYLYEDGVKYQKTEENGKESYYVVRVYEEGRTALKLKEGTTEIEAGAFQDCENLEILVLPDSLSVFDQDVIADCGALETILCENADITILNGKARSIHSEISAEIFKTGGIFSTFVYDDGIVYGQAADGSYTLLNVRTDYTGKIEIREKTKSLYRLAFSGCQELTDIQITDEASLEEIGDGCFEAQTLLKTVDLSGCTKLKTIGAEAFYLCTELDTLKLPESLETLGERAFYGCSQLQTVTVPESVTSLGEGCFEDCTSIQTVEINGSLAGISRYAFYGCRKLTRVTFGEKMKVKLTVIGAEAFAQCWNLEQMDLLEMKKLEWIGERAFEGCESLTTVRLPVLLAKLPDYCFADCETLSIVQLDTAELANLGEKIFGDTLPRYVHLWVDESLYAEAAKAYEPILDGDYGEGTCEKIFGVTNDKLEFVGGVTFEKTEEGKILKKADSAVSGAYTIPSDTIRIEAGAFEGCDGLTEVIFLRGAVMELENRCFADCKGLKTLYLFSNISNWADETFMDCTALEKIYLGDKSTDPIIERIGTAAFKNCTGLKEEGAVEMRAVIRSFGKECFKGCSSLPSLAANTTSMTGLQVIEDSAFEDCAKLRVFLNSKFTGLTTIGKYAFRNCDTLAQPSIPASVTSIGEGCFMECDNLKYVSFYGAIEEYPKDCFKNCPQLIRTGGTAAAFAGLRRIGEDAYAGCTSLTNSTSWNLGRYTGLEEIGNGAFANCTGLTYATLSATLQKLGSHVFDGCIGMGLLAFGGTEVPEIGSFSPETMGESFAIRVPDSQAEGDQIYLSYLKRFTELLGEEQALQLLDSATDGAKERYEAGTAQPEVTEAAASTEETTGQAADGTVTGKTTEEKTDTATDLEKAPEEPQTEQTKEETDK